MADLVQQNQHLQRQLASQMELLLQQQRREQMVYRISYCLQQALDLDQMLATVVAEVRQCLQLDRVIVSQTTAAEQQVIAESRENVAALLGLTLPNPDLEAEGIAAVAQGDRPRPRAINTSPDITLRQTWGIQSRLLVPLQIQGQVWGWLEGQQCHALRQWQPFESDLLQQVADRLGFAIHHHRLYQQTQDQARREQALNRVIRTIRSSLELPAIFSSVVTEVGELLGIERADIVQYQPEHRRWLNVADYHKNSDLPSALGVEIPDDGNAIAAQLKQLQIVRIDDASTCDDAINRRFAETFPGGWLLVPLAIDGKVWGSLSLHRHQQPCHWRDADVDLASGVADHLAIAIQQATLYQQVQQVNTTLEAQIQARTTQLQQALSFDAALRRITERMRDSLDEQQIFQTVVQELGQALGVGGCDVALYDIERRISTISYEYIETVPIARGREVLMTEFWEGYSQLLQGKVIQFCLLTQHFETTARGCHTTLACPIVDGPDIVGDLWLFKPEQDVFTEDEVHLVRQVASQCAIAIRQARLYQASQAQVAELRRLNYLKDDFLSTISHELRTPISNMQMAIHMLKLISDPDRRSKYQQILETECRREADLINNLLDLQRLEANDYGYGSMDSIDLQEWLPQLIKSLQSSITARQQHIALSLESLPLLISDRTQLKRLLTELLNNASKHTPAGGQIILSVTLQSRLQPLAPGQSPESAKLLALTATAEPIPSTPVWFSFEVRNSADIPATEIPQLFDKFYRVPKTDPWQQGGTGLGLALVRKLAELMQGEIAVESGDGWTTFTLHLPSQPSGHSP